MAPTSAADPSLRVTSRGITPRRAHKAAIRLYTFAPFLDCDKEMSILEPRAFGWSVKKIRQRSLTKKALFVNEFCSYELIVHELFKDCSLTFLKYVVILSRLLWLILYKGTQKKRP